MNNNSDNSLSRQKARPIMILGTASHAGKTAIAAGLCRLLARRGERVAPFKAQNMSNNSHVTPEGAEIGRAQAMQARAARVDSHADMNPVLIKPSGDGRAQVVLSGRPWRNNRSPREYYADKAFLATEARHAFDRLAARFDRVILEGAGSPAEINLREADFVNGAMAEHARARCLLVADIDRGGVFASILGTIELMEPRHRNLLAGVLINKFRGDPTLLEPGLREIVARTGVPVLGVLPWLDGLDLEEEDSLGLPESGPAPTPARLDIAVVRLPHLSNFTDWQSLEREPGLHLRYVEGAAGLGNPDLIVLPGSKAVRADLAWLAARGLDRALAASAERLIPMLGLCGGYQMLGREVRDPLGVEGEAGATPGLGLLPVVTGMEPEKELGRVSGRNLGLPFLPVGQSLEGYEIHMGRTRPEEGSLPALEITSRNGAPCRLPCGAVAADRPVFGAYMHGLFEDAAVRQGLRNWLLARRGLPRDNLRPGREPMPDGLDRLADALEKLPEIKSLLGV